RRQVRRRAQVGAVELIDDREPHVRPLTLTLSPGYRGEGTLLHYGCHHLRDDLLQRILLLPCREVRLELAQVGVVADVVADAVGFGVAELRSLAARPRDQLDALK